MRRNILNPRTARPSVPVLRTANRPPTLAHSAPGAPGTVAPGAPGTVAPVTVAPVAPIVTESNDSLIYCFSGTFESATSTVAIFVASLKLRFLGLPQTTIFNKIYFNWDITNVNIAPVSQFYSVNASLFNILRRTDADITHSNSFSEIFNAASLVLPKGQELGVFLPISSFDEFSQFQVTIAKNDLTILGASHYFSCSLVLLYKR